MTALKWILLSCLCVPALSSATTVQCYYAQDYVEDKNGSYKPENLLPFFTMEVKKDRIITKMSQDGASDVLFPYLITKEWLNEKGPDREYKNVRDPWNKPGFANRLGFAEKKRKDLEIETTYNQALFIWGKDSDITTVTLDGQKVEMYTFAYFFPAIEEGQHYRVVGDDYYCPNAQVQKMFFDFSVNKSLTIY